MSFYCPSSPTDLCRMLGLAFDADQGDVMDRLARSRGAADVRIRASNDEPAEGELLGPVFRAALMSVLWRALTLPGSRTVLLAPPDPGQVTAGHMGSLAMAYLAELCRCQDPVLSSLTRLRAWYCIELTAEPGWELRMLPCVASAAAEAAPRALTAVILDAGNSDPAFVESARALESVAKEPRGLLLRLW